MSDLIWKKVGDEAFEKEWSEGEYRVEGRVILGGNGRWTCYVTLEKLGRRKKRGFGRVGSKAVAVEFPTNRQRVTKDAAMLWANTAFNVMISRAGRMAMRGV